MDPLSIGASLAGVITAAIQSTKSLHDAIKRFKGRDKTLARLYAELGDLVNILSLLEQVVNTEALVLKLLRGPIDRCSQVCREFESSMTRFREKSKTNLLDWAKMEFMRGDINEFIETVDGYKATISVGLATINMHNSKISEKVLQEYNEMIKDTVYELEIRLQRIDEKLAQVTTENAKACDASVDLNDEKAVTKQCLRICEDARSYIKSLTERESSLLQEAPEDATDENIQKAFEAQLLARQALGKNTETLSEVIGRLQEHLMSLVMNSSPENENERARLQKDMDISKQCIEVCKAASEVSQQKIFRVGETIAEDDSDLMVVTTLADLFDVKKAVSKNNSTHLVGSMSNDALMHTVEKRYGSRFGAVAQESGPGQVSTESSYSVSDTQKGKRASQPHGGNAEQFSGPETRPVRPSPNEMRKRMVSVGE